MNVKVGVFLSVLIDYIVSTYVRFIIIFVKCI